MSTTYRITHGTAYEYASDVSSGYSLLRMRPRDLPGQRCVSSTVAIEPRPADRHEHVDFFGNHITYFAVQDRHRALSVEASSLVEVADDRGGLTLMGDRSWEEVRDAVHRAPGPDAVDASQFALDSTLVARAPQFAAYAEPSFTPGRPVAEAVCDLAARIHADFEFAPGETAVDTPLAEVFAARHGVCQDFTHVAIACARSMGLPARYVSGYLETDPPPGRERLVGADVSHAWFAVLVPGAGWLEVDPTNNRIVNQRYVVTAYGRDYHDVAPITGVIYTRGRTKSLKVTVDVAAVPAGA